MKARFYEYILLFLITALAAYIILSIIQVHAINVYPNETLYCATIRNNSETDLEHCKSQHDDGLEQDYNVSDYGLNYSATIFKRENDTTCITQYDSTERFYDGKGDCWVKKK